MGANLKRNQSGHEAFIPMLADLIGAESYLEFGTHLNETIARVNCPKRYGVDLNAALCSGATMFRMTTAEFIANHAAAHAPFDLVFIDADHKRESVQRDFESIWPHVAIDGLVLLHDTNPETIADAADGLCGNAWEFAREYRGEAVTLPYHPGLTIIRKRGAWGPK